MKRFTETNKWGDPWFRKLSAAAKLVWLYACDHCDCVGTVHLDCDLLSSDLRIKITHQHFEEIGGERLTSTGSDRYFIPKFIPFQYGELSPNCTPHRKVIAEIERKGIRRVGIGYALGTHTYKNGVEWTGKDKEGGVGETSPPDAAPESPSHLSGHLNTARMQNKWQVWQTHRRAFKKPGDWGVLFSEQAEWLSKFTEPDAFEVVSASIRNGWQGLFEPRKSAAQNRQPQRSPGGNF